MNTSVTGSTSIFVDRVKVNHLHYHVYPRTNEDELYQQVERHETEMFVDLPPDEAAMVAKVFESDPQSLFEAKGLLAPRASQRLPVEGT